MERMAGGCRCCFQDSCPCSLPLLPRSPKSSGPGRAAQQDPAVIGGSNSSKSPSQCPLKDTRLMHWLPPAIPAPAGTLVTWWSFGVCCHSAAASAMVLTVILGTCVKPQHCCVYGLMNEISLSFPCGFPPHWLTRSCNGTDTFPHTHS